MRDITVEQENEIIRLYNEGHGQSYCSKKVFGVNNIGEVKKVLRNNGIHIRTKAEANRLNPQNQNKYTQNNDYFIKQNHNMAWVLGFLAADGSVRKNENEIKVTVARQDRDVLEKIRKDINATNPIKDFVTSNGYEASTIIWTNAKHKQDLALYNIIPAKTFCLQPPLNLEKKYWIDFIRGYFDGDGSVNFIDSHGKKHYTALRWQICSATTPILQWIIDFLYEEYDIPKVKIQTQKRAKHCLYSFQYSTNSTKRIFDILYNGYLHMDRKYNHYKEIIDKISK